MYLRLWIICVVNNANKCKRDSSEQIKFTGLCKKINMFNAKLMFITVLTTDRHYIISQSRQIRATPPYKMCLNSILILSSYVSVGLSSVSSTVSWPCYRLTSSQNGLCYVGYVGKKILWRVTSEKYVTLINLYYYCNNLESGICGLIQYINDTKQRDNCVLRSARWRQTSEPSVFSHKRIIRKTRKMNHDCEVTLT